MMKVSDLLRTTSKGRLSYEREITRGQVKILLEQCSSPPELSSYHRENPNQPSVLSAAGPDREGSEKSDISKDEIEDRKHDTAGSLGGSPLSSRENVTFAKALIHKDHLENKEESKLPSSQASPKIHSTHQSKGDNSDGVAKPKHTSPASPEYGRSQMAIKQYEILWDHKAQMNLQNRQREFESSTRRLQEEAEQCLKQLERNALLRVRQQHEQTETQLRMEAEHVKKQQLKLQENHRSHQQMLDAKIHEAEKRKRKLQEEAKKREEEMKERIKTIHKTHTDFTARKDAFIAMFDGFQYKEHLPDAAKKPYNLVKQISKLADSSLGHIRETGEATHDIVDKMEKYLELVKNASEFVKQHLEEAEKQGKSAEGKAAEASAAEVARKQQEQQHAAQKASQEPPKVTPTGEEVLCADEIAFLEYMKLKQKLADTEKSVHTLVSNVQMKKYRFELVKAVNTPVNAISPVSGEHLRDNLQRLLALLSGNQVEISSKRISAREHPEGIVFCKNLIAKMIVKKGEEQVSSKHESAFAIAAVAVSLWCEHPDIGDLLMGHFHSVCPYIVPYYIPREEGQTMEDYYRTLGYKYEGSVENQDKFLKRMSGLMRLYASMMVVPNHRGQNSPHGLQYAWIWLSRTLNMEPRADITATMIYDLLQVTGHALGAHYKRQFQKLLYTLIKDFLPKLKNVTSQGGVGSVSRLEIFLETCVKNHGQMKPPEGLLPSNFWYT